MSFINPILKESGKFADLCLTLCVVGSRKIYAADNFATSPWHVFAPNLKIYGIDADPEACEAANATLAAQGIDWFEHHYPLAVGGTVGESTLYITNAVHCSSLYAPNTSYVSRFQGFSTGLALEASIDIETTTLDAFAKAESIEGIDVLKVDVQGADLDVLRGGQEIIHRSTLAVVVEVEFSEIYQGQPLFSDIDQYLRQQGFVLFDLSTDDAWCRLPRQISPVRSHRRGGQLLWADALYLRDLLKEDSKAQTAHLYSPESLLKLGAIADAFDFPDYALELLSHLTVNYGQDPRWNCCQEVVAALEAVKPVINADLETLPIVKLLSEC
ncbi:FkbM family methyltransferase [Thermosynechococcaceae cyanobacterium Okahandja]